MPEVSVGKKSIAATDDVVQLCGFKIGDNYYGIPVLEVQEVVKPQTVTPVPLAPEYIDGLINLRGQIVTAVNLRTLFEVPGERRKDFMNIIVHGEDSLYALVVDEILDVIDVDPNSFEKPPIPWMIISANILGASTNLKASF